MRFASLLLAFALLPLAGCDREKAEADLPAKSEQPDPKAAPARAPASPEEPPVQILRKLATLPAEDQAATLENHIYDLPDHQIHLVLESIVEHENPALKRTLLTTLFEETGLRPPIIRLPLLLEIARQPETEPTLRATIMAELGSELNAEHGTSWSDWALAIEEHLAETEGLIRVE